MSYFPVPNPPKIDDQKRDPIHRDTTPFSIVDFRRFRTSRMVHFISKGFFKLLLLPLILLGNETEFYLESLKIQPENTDYMFRLAESYHSAHQYADAIHWYQLRLKKGGSRDDLWTSKYQLAQCYEKMGDWQNALYWYLDTYQTDPGRADPLLNAAVHYRVFGENDLAYIFAKHGSRIGSSHNYRFDEELSIVSFYTRFKEEGYKAASDLLLRKDVPWYIKSQAYQNILYYTQNLKNAHFIPIKIDLPLITEKSDEEYHPMNPSILRTEEGYQIICRSVNYTQKGAKEFATIDPDGYYKTRNFLVTYNQDFQLLSQKEITENLVRQRLPSFVLGLEDARIFLFQGSYWFTCTTRDNTEDGTPQISVCKIGHDGCVEKMTLLRGPDPLRCEKNWLPFVKDGIFHVIYSYDPFIIYQPDVETGECKLDLSYEPTADFTSFRGSAGPIPFQDGYLVLIHEVTHFPDQSRCYLHRFLYLDHRFFIKQISKPFTFLHQGVEICASMTLNHEGTHLILAIGIEDNKAYLCTVDIKTVNSYLVPLDLRL